MLGQQVGHHGNEIGAVERLDPGDPQLGLGFTGAGRAGVRSGLMDVRFCHAAPLPSFRRSMHQPGAPETGSRGAPAYAEPFTYHRPLTLMQGSGENALPATALS